MFQTGNQGPKSISKERVDLLNTNNPGKNFVTRAFD